MLTRDLVAALLKRKKYEPTGVAELLAAHEEATSAAHDVADLTTQRSVQQLLSSERHEAIFQKLMAKSTPRSNNLMLACALPHASDWLLAPPIAGLGLGLSSVEFRTALKFRLGIPLTRSRSLARPSAKRAWNARTKWTSSGITPSVATMAPRTCAGHLGPLSESGWPLGSCHRAEEPDRRFQRKARRHHRAAVPSRLYLIGVRRHHLSPIAKKIS